jgi:hypothetical protein
MGKGQSHSHSAGDRVSGVHKDYLPGKYFTLTF